MVGVVCICVGVISTSINQDQSDGPSGPSMVLLVLVTLAFASAAKFPTGLAPCRK